MSRFVNVMTVLGLALLFALSIMLVDYLYEGSPQNESVKLALIAAWWIPFSSFACRVTQGKKC